MSRIILASASPRRIEMMRNKGYEPEVVPANIEESLPYEMQPEEATMYLAKQKAEHVCGKVMKATNIADGASRETTIIAADTVVVHRGRIIGKPANEEEAFAVLSSMRNDSHQVITGVCIIKIGVSERCDTPSTHIETFYSKTTVFFEDYTDEELRKYVATEEPYDKAGGYAIQGAFGKHVEHIEGSLNNVIGFPWEMIEERLGN